MTSPTQKPGQPRLLRFADSLLFLVDRYLGRRLVLHEQKVIDKACRKTGLNEFGTDLFRAPLKIICDSTRNGPPRRLLARLWLKDSVTSCLTSLLRIQDEITRHPEILDEQIREPVFILGAPRTGTTFLHRLLARDPANRTPRLWEMVEPIPPPEESTYENDRRIKMYERASAIFYYCVPEFKRIHDISDMHEPEECLNITRNVLVDVMYSSIIDNYDTWYSTNRDSHAVYEFHKLQLKVLQWKFKRTRWVLKSPMHLENIPAILAAYPDAHIIHTHRPIQYVIPSAASLLYYFMTFFYAYPDNVIDDFGQIMLDYISNILNIGLEQREQIGTNTGHASFYDLSYNDFVKNPIGAVKDIYSAFGFEFSNSAVNRMTEYLDAAPKDKHGKHAYSLKQFGLDQAALDTKFKNYCEYFCENGEFSNMFTCGGNRVRRHFL